MNSAISAGNSRNLVARAVFILFCLLLVPIGLGVLPGLAGAAVTASPTSIDNFYCRIGSQQWQSVTFHNDDSANDVNIYLSVAGLDRSYFRPKQSNLTVPKGGSVTATIVFAPTSEGGEKVYDATLRVTGGTSLNIPLSGKAYFAIADVIDVRESPQVEFGPCKIGERKTIKLWLVNTGDDTVTIDKMIPDLAPTTDSGQTKYFTVEFSSKTIQPHMYAEAVVTFIPVKAGQYSNKVEIIYDGFVASSELSLSGRGVYSSEQIISVASRLDFGNCTLDNSKTATLLFYNNGSYDVKITDIELPDNSVFSGVTDLAGKVIPAYGVLDVVLTFTPKSVQNFVETMRVSYDSWIPDSEVTLSGTGTADPELKLAPGAFEFGTVGVGQKKSRTLVLTNTGDVAIDIISAQTTSSVFKVSGLEGMLAVGETRVGTVTFAPAAKGRVDGALDLLFDTLSAKNIPLSGTGAEILINPSELNFAGLTVGESSSLSFTIINSSINDLQVKGAVTGTPGFQVSGIEAGDIIPAHGGSITGQVSFHPVTSGYFADNLYINIGPVQQASIPENEIDWGTQYTVHLTGLPYVDFTMTELETFTADTNYRLGISAASPQPGRLYVLLSHDPLSSGVIYALTSDGSMKPFPYQSPDAWQDLWYRPSTGPENLLDLSQIDLRQLGCSQCQGPAGSSGEEFHFGNIIIKPPVKNYNNSSDFKYMGGTLYMGTFVKDPYLSADTPFIFNEGLLEFQILHIRSLAGVWRVTSRYYGDDRVHPNLLSVQEQDGQVTASWPPYPVTASYSNNDAAYILDFTYRGFHYIYKINQLTTYSFKGTYSCYYRDQIIEENAPVSGERVR